jgi:hypothetical protein
MDAARVFDEIVSRVEAGLQLDDVPGRAGEMLDGPGMFRGQRRIYTRGTPEFATALAQGQLEPLPRTPPATVSAVERAESLLGAALPDLLRRLYLEVSNGGFGACLRHSRIGRGIPRRHETHRRRHIGKSLRLA